MNIDDIAAPQEHLELLYRIGLSLAAEHDHQKLLERILSEARTLCRADGGTLYLRSEDNTLEFSIVQNASLGINSLLDPSHVNIQDIPLLDASDQPNLHNIASAAAHQAKTINVTDADADTRYDFSGARRFDKEHNYHSVSFLTVPLLSSRREVIGVLQLINALDPAGHPIAFSDDQQRTVEALAAQAGIALDNQNLLQAQRNLLESFIKLIAAAIDAKSPYTGGHCERVPVLTEMIAASLCEARDGPFTDFDLNEEQWYELRIAAWLHDCGKIITPVHVMDKSTKLETIHDRIAEVRLRFEILRRDAEISMLRAQLNGKPEDEAEQKYQARIRELDNDLAFLENANTGGEFLPPEDQARIASIGARLITLQGKDSALLNDEEIRNLQVSRGTLNDEERLIINGHMVHTLRMLQALPLPPELRNVPEYAGGHHEKMDGTGYPRGLYAGDMSIPARAMAIADVFEALTAADRPYKPGKPLSESLNIMAQMKRAGHLDPELFDHFIRSGVYLEYAQRFLPDELIDDVDEAAMLAIRPEPLELPPEDVRRERWQDFLPGYRDL